MQTKKVARDNRGAAIHVGDTVRQGGFTGKVEAIRWDSRFSARWEDDSEEPVYDIPVADIEVVGMLNGERTQVFAAADMVEVVS